MKLSINCLLYSNDIENRNYNNGVKDLKKSRF